MRGLQLPALNLQPSFIAYKDGLIVTPAGAETPKSDSGERKRGRARPRREPRDADCFWLPQIELPFCSSQPNLTHARAGRVAASCRRPFLPGEDSLLKAKSLIRDYNI